MATKRELDILGRAFEAEIAAALEERPTHLLQSRSKVAAKLEEDGLLEKIVVVLEGRFPVKVSGYQLTHAGRYVYCQSCKH